MERFRAHESLLILRFWDNLTLLMWDGIWPLTEFLDENAGNGHSVLSGLVLSHRLLMLTLAIFKCHGTFLVSFEAQAFREG